VPEFIQIWAQAIAQFEGFNTPGTVAARNNNPGNLKFAGQGGATGKDANGFAVFSSPSAGWQALYNQLSLYVNEFPSFSILQIMAHYLGQSTPTSDAQGNAFTYASFVASALGVDVSTPLADVTDVTNVTTAADLPVDISGPSTGEILGIIAGGTLIFVLLSRLF